MLVPVDITDARSNDAMGTPLILVQDAPIQLKGVGDPAFDWRA